MVGAGAFLVPPIPSLVGRANPQQAGLDKAASDVRPGWLGLGFRYHRDPTQRAKAPVWLQVEVIVPNGPAAGAGIQLRDAIIKINNKPLRLKSDNEVLDFFARNTPGQRVVLTVAPGQAQTNMELIAVEIPDQYLERWKLNRAIAKEHAARP